MQQYRVYTRDTELGGAGLRRAAPVSTELYGLCQIYPHKGGTPRILLHYPKLVWPDYSTLLSGDKSSLNRLNYIDTHENRPTVPIAKPTQRNVL